MKIFKRIKWSYVVLSAMFLLLGIFLVANPETSLIMICRILGAAMAVFGVMKIVLYFIREVEGVAIRFDFAVGLFCIILGALMLWRAPALTDVLSVMIGLLVLVDSVFKLQVAVDSRRMGAHSWWVTLVCTVVCLVLGVLLVFNPFDGKQVLTIMMGVSLIVDGVQNLCTVVYAAVFVKDVKAAVRDFVDDATAVETTGEVVGEDKPDDHAEYNGLADYDAYRAEECAWLKKAVRSEEFLTASARIVLLHIPPAAGAWHGSVHLNELFVPVLNEAGIDLMLCGHDHRYSFHPAGERDAKFPIVVNDNRSCVRCDVADSLIRVRIAGPRDKTVHTHEFPLKPQFQP